MGSLDVSSGTTSMRARHGCPRDYVVVDTPCVCPVYGRRCHGWPGSENVHTRGGYIRLLSVGAIYTLGNNRDKYIQDMDTDTNIVHEQLFRMLKIIVHLENVWGDRARSSRWKWNDNRSHGVIPSLSNQNSCNRFAEKNHLILYQSDTINSLNNSFEENFNQEIQWICNTYYEVLM